MIHRYLQIATVATPINGADAQGDPTTVLVQPGYVLDAINWDGVSAYETPAGTELRLDDAGQYQIGETIAV